MTRKRRDANHGEIKSLYERLGCSVRDTADIPGALDLIVGYRGVDARVEIKDGSKIPSARKLTPAEQDEIERWKGYPPAIIETTEDVHDHVHELGVASLVLAEQKRRS
jgi:hypothetical protein